MSLIMNNQITSMNTPAFLNTPSCNSVGTSPCLSPATPFYSPTPLSMSPNLMPVSTQILTPYTPNLLPISPFAPIVQISAADFPVIPMTQFTSNQAAWSNFTACYPVMINGVQQLATVSATPSSSGSLSMSRTSSVSSAGFPETYSRSVSRSNSYRGDFEPAKKNVEFNLYATGNYSVISTDNFQQVLEQAMKKHVHPDVAVDVVYDPTKPNQFKKNMVNGVIISCSITTDGDSSFTPELTQVNAEIVKAANALYSDIQVFNEDPLDINRAASADGERVSYKNYNTDLCLTTEKISMNKFRNSGEVNAFCDKVRELLFSYSDNISFCKAVYTKKKNVFKTFYITLCFGENSHSECVEVHQAFQKLGVSTYKNKSDKKQQSSRRL